MNGGETLKKQESPEFIRGECQRQLLPAFSLLEKTHFQDMCEPAI
jgi:hypothetical protein